MILQALVKYYDILAEDPESGISKEGYSKAKVSYALNLSENGDLLEIIPLKQEVKRGSKTVELPIEDIVPEQIKKSSGIASNFLCENASYALYPRAVQRHFLKTVFCNKTELHSVKHSTKDNYIGITLMV